MKFTKGILLAAALVGATALGGCAVYPAAPGYYRPAPVYVAPVVSFGYGGGYYHRRYWR